MATRGRGQDPLDTSWLTRRRRRGQSTDLLHDPVGLPPPSDLQSDVFNEYFFDADDGSVPIRVYNIGKDYETTAAFGGTLYATTTVGPEGIPAGSLIVVIAMEGTTSVGTGVTDDASNTYTLATSSGVGAGGKGQVYYSYNSNALVAGDVITYEKSTDTTFATITVFYAVGIETASDPYDSAVTATATGTSGTPSVTSGTPSEAGELIVGAIALNGRETDQFNQDYTDGFLAPPDYANSLQAFNDRPQVGGGTLVNSGTGTKTYNPTITSRDWAAMIVGFKKLNNSGQTLTPSLFTNTQTFFSPNVIRRLTPSLFTNTQTFFSPKLNLRIYPSLYTNSQTFFSPTVRNVNPITPDLFTNTQTFFSPTVTPGVATLTPSLYTNTNTFFSPTVLRGTINLTPSLYTNTQTFFSPSVANVTTLTPSLYTNTNTFYSPTVTRGTITLTPSLYTNTQTFFSPTVTYSYTLTPSLYTNGNTFFSPTVNKGTVTLTPNLFTNTNTFFSPTVSQDGVAPTTGSWLPWGRRKRRKSRSGI